MDNSNSSIEFCNLLFLNRDFDGKEKERFSIILKDFLNQNTSIPYDLITQRIINTDDENELDQLLINSSKHIDEVNLDLGDYLNVQIGNSISYQILLHINTSFSIKKGMIESKRQITEYYDVEINKAKSEIHSLKQKFYTDFITIIGIFTSIIFALFGGAQMLSKIFGENKLSDYHQVVNVLFLGSFFLLSICVLLQVLFSGIDALTLNNKYKVPKTVIVFSIIFFLIMCFTGLFLMHI